MLSFYAVLRSIPNKAMGVTAMLMVFVALAVQPFVNQGGGRFRVAYEFLFWTFVADMFLLTWLGASEVTPITMMVGQLCTSYLFLYLFVLIPATSLLESRMLETSK